MAKRKNDFDDLASQFETAASEEPNEIESSDVAVPTGSSSHGAAALQIFEAIEERAGDFNYEQLGASDRLFLLDRQKAIVRLVGMTIIMIGDELRRAKEVITKNCKRGAWTQWLNTALSFSEQTARNYIHASIWAEISPTVGVLPPAALYLGATAPDEVKTRIVEMIEAGDAPEISDIKDMIQAHKAREASDMHPQSEEEEARIPVQTAAVRTSGDEREENLEVSELSNNIQFDKANDKDPGSSVKKVEAPEASSSTALFRTDSEKISESVVYIEENANRAANEIISWLREVLSDDDIRYLISLLKATNLKCISDQLDLSRKKY